MLILTWNNYKSKRGYRVKQACRSILLATLKQILHYSTLPKA